MCYLWASVWNKRLMNTCHVSKGVAWVICRSLNRLKTIWTDVHNFWLTVSWMFASKCMQNFPLHPSCVLTLPVNTLTNDCARCLPPRTSINCACSSFLAFSIEHFWLFELLLGILITTFWQQVSTGVHFNNNNKSHYEIAFCWHSSAIDYKLA